MPDPDLEIRGGGGEGLVIQTLRKGGGGRQFRLKIAGLP